MLFALLSGALVLMTIACNSALAIEWIRFDNHRRAELKLPSNRNPGFTSLSTLEMGIGFTNRLSEERSLTNQIFLNGSGVAAGDIDGDGLCDLYFCGLDSANALYRNLGNWRFADITERAGVACLNQASTGAALADIDGDGDLDLLVTGVASGVRLFLNDGHGIFNEATDRWGLRSAGGSVTMALADIDGDARLDLYVVNYRNDTMRDMPGIRFNIGVTNRVYRLLSVNGRPASAPDLLGRFTFDQSGGVLENGEADQLFRNTGTGRFARVDWTSGSFLGDTGEPAQIPYDWGLTAMFRDVNGDNAPDLYVCNDFQSPDRFWINNGRGQFRPAHFHAIRQTSLFSMGVDFADIDRDGHDDFFVADMLSRKHADRQVQVMGPMAYAQIRSAETDRPQSSRNMLYQNRGNGTYAEIARLSGIHASDWSWCPVFLDVDLDGYEDLLVTTGHWRDLQHADIARELDRAKTQQRLSPRDELRMRSRFPRLDTPNAAFRNRGDLTFEDAGSSWGFDSRRISHGMALADLDNDGDLDVVANSLNDAPLVYRNESTAPRIAVRLRGNAPNTAGIGAKVRVAVPGLPLQTQEFVCGGRYLSSDQSIRTFAAHTPSSVASIEVTWRSGRRTNIENVPANHLLEIEEAGALDSTPDLTSISSPPLFTDVSGALNHQHVDASFDDFSRHPLIPRQLSGLGPGISWIDFNADGWDDLLIGTGRGGRLGVFRNDRKGTFVRQRAKAFDTPSEHDLTTVLGWSPNLTNLVLLIGTAASESAEANPASLRRFSVVTGADDIIRLEHGSSIGPLTMADIDGDSDLDLFVGGRVIPGRYPEPASSSILVNDNGQLHLDREITRSFANLGLVSGAAFSDLDLDGFPELILATEWGPIQIFQNRRGRFVPWHPEVRVVAHSSAPDSRLSPFNSTVASIPLDHFTGWWNSIATGDFDGDGRFDLVAGNWGRNTSQTPSLDHPLKLHFAISDSIGTPMLIESYFDPDSGKQVPVRDWATLSSVFPTLQERFPSFTAFSTASVSDLLTAEMPTMNQVHASTLDSVILLNRSGHFEMRLLPIEAQFSPVFGIAVGDFDGDGSNDLVLAQNFFGVAAADSRQDAGCGLWLQGDGGGGFAAIPPGKSGLAVFGEGRGAAISDFDQDGRLDLAIGQRNGSTKLYRNTGGRPGLRIRLRGPAENRNAIGAVVRLQFANGTMGPAHEIQSGTGYWSQHSTDIVLGLPSEPAALEIQWPGGMRERVEITSGGVFTRTMPSSAPQ